MAILRDPNGTNHEISYYGIQGLANELQIDIDYVKNYFKNLGF